MANKQDEIKRVRGLALQSNSFKVPEGSYERLDNCTIVQDDIVQKRRGSYLFHDIGLVEEGRNLSSYQEKLIGFCENEVQVYNQNSSGDYTSTTVLTGAAFTVSEGEKARNVQSNGNLYFTADEGIFTVESVTAPVLEAGIDAATDLQIFLLEQDAVETFFRPDSQLAYRVLFGRKDANDNTVIGAPSQLVSATNPITTSDATLAATTVTVDATGHGLSVNDIVYIVNADSTGASGNSSGSKVMVAPVTLVLVKSRPITVLPLVPSIMSMTCPVSKAGKGAPSMVTTPVTVS